MDHAGEQLSGRKLVIDLKNVTLTNREEEKTLLRHEERRHVSGRDALIRHVLKRWPQKSLRHEALCFVDFCSTGTLQVEEGREMFGARKLGKQPPSLPYATTAEFGQIFEKDMNPLYHLSLLLTGDEATAEQCFVRSLDTAQEGTPVFKEWAEGWTRRTIILNAIRIMRPRPTADAAESSGRVAGDPARERAEIAEIVKLPVFERLTFVMSVLEGYSDYECALHLGSTRADVTAARTDALERIGGAAELRRKLVSIAPSHEDLGENSESRSQFQAMSRQAASA